MVNSPDTRYPPIDDYGAVGDCSTLALVSRTGSIDWLCLPRFSSPSVFGALLDRDRGGRFRVGPAGPADGDDIGVERRYIEDTVVLETTFYTPGGVLRLTDLMPVLAERDKPGELRPEREILRKVECLEGTVDVRVLVDPRPNYGAGRLGLDHRGQLGIFGEFGGRALIVRSGLDMAVGDDGHTAVGGQTLEAGQVEFISLSFVDQEPATLALLGEHAQRRLERTVDWWRGWVDQCHYQGDYRDEVVRSALTLKMMIFPPSGAIVAAPTTSLPEEPGGSANWDYRYCWLRDASMVVRSLLELGYNDESEAFLGWLLDATRMTWPQLQIMYDVFGETRLSEHSVGWLDGYRHSQPVRVGNGAHNQLQMGIYGEVIEAVFHYVQHGAQLDWSQARMLRGLGEVVCNQWERPDAGIWESRGQDRDHTHSKAMCWVAMDRLIRLHDQGCLDVPVDHYRHVRTAIASAIELHGYNQDLDSYVGVFGGDQVDAALFLMLIYGYDGGPRRPRQSSCDRLRQQLGKGELMFRSRSKDDSTQNDTAAFGICSFWNVSALARQHRLDDAEKTFDALLGYANDLGLFAEEIDPDTGRARGNFPQAFTHVGIINAAVTIAEHRDHMRTQTQPPACTLKSTNSPPAEPSP